MEESTRNGKNKKVVWDLMSGGGAGAISRTLTAPIERVKVVLQVQAVAKVPENQKYRGIIDCLIRIPREQGFFAYWRGNGLNVIRIIPNSAIKFSTFDYYKSLAFPAGEQSYEGRERYVRKMVCGGLSGLTTLIPVYPLDLARTRISADTTGQYRGVMHMLRFTISKQGFLGLYSGLPISLCGIMPYLAISFATYDHLKEVTAGNAAFESPFGKVLLGSCSAIVSQSFAYPFDTVRRHMQVAGGLGQRAPYKNAIACISSIYSQYGWKGFYRGILANAARAAPQAGIEFACYDLLSSLFVKARGDHHTSSPKKKGNSDSSSVTITPSIARTISAKLSEGDRNRMLVMFQSLQGENGIVTKYALQEKLSESGYSPNKGDIVQFILEGTEEAQAVDFASFKKLCTDDLRVLELLEGQVCE